jgi:hypothetical protein
MDMLLRNPSDHHQCSRKCTTMAMESVQEEEWAQALVRALVPAR